MYNSKVYFFILFFNLTRHNINQSKPVLCLKEKIKIHRKKKQSPFRCTVHLHAIYVQRALQKHSLLAFLALTLNFQLLQQVQKPYGKEGGGRLIKSAILKKRCIASNFWKRT